MNFHKHDNIIDKNNGASAKHDAVGSKPENVNVDEGKRVGANWCQKQASKTTKSWKMEMKDELYMIR